MRVGGVIPVRVIPVMVGRVIPVRSAQGECCPGEGVWCGPSD